MNLRTLRKLLDGQQIPLLFGLTFLAKPVYHAAFVAAAGSHGILRLLRDGPRTLSEVAEFMGCDSEGERILRNWLDLGVRLGQLRATDEGYALKGWWARVLSKPRNDPALAALEEIIQLHHAALIAVPSMAKEGRRFTWEDYDVNILSRVGPLVEPFNHEATELVIPRRGPAHLLDVGCGLGGNIRHATLYNPELTAVGMEMIADVAVTATDNMQTWGLADRVKIETADFRTAAMNASFDSVVSHGNYYFFSNDERLPFLEQMYAALKPGGKALVATACRGKHLSFELISLWFSSANFGGPLPVPGEVKGLMRQAGFVNVEVHELMPGGYFAFVGTKPPKTFN